MKIIGIVMVKFLCLGDDNFIMIVIWRIVIEKYILSLEILKYGVIKCILELINL